MINSTLHREEKKAPVEYPYIGINYTTNTVVLFKKKDAGTILYHTDESKIGEYSNRRHELTFSSCPHAVCLKNVMKIG